MKENPDRMYVHPQFKKILAVESASRGKSIIEFTKEICMEPDPFKKLVEEWEGKWKKKSTDRGFDFP